MDHGMNEMPEQAMPNHGVQLSKSPRQPTSG